MQSWRVKAIQNLAVTILITIISSVVFFLEMSASERKWAVLSLVVCAPACTLVVVSRRYPERAAAHFQLAKRYAALAASCQTSVTRYEEKLFGDSEFQALYDQHILALDAVNRDVAYTFH